MVGETNRAPFDLPEAEGELVGGFHTEYSSLKFALFMLAEYVNMTTVSALATTLFLGGWQAPWPISLWDSANNGWWPLLWFTTKVWVFLFVFIWLRATLPRLRYDQFMAIGWKILIPASLVWIMVVAVTRTIEPTAGGRWAPTISMLTGTVGGVTAVIVWKLLQSKRSRKTKRYVASVDPVAGGFPVPPLPGQRRLVEPLTADPAAPTRNGASIRNGALLTFGSHDV